MTIHQPRPDILALFDKIILLCPGGRVAFEGRVQAALDHFATLGYSCPNQMNPADFFLDCLAQDDRSEALHLASIQRRDHLAAAWTQRQGNPVESHEKSFEILHEKAADILHEKALEASLAKQQKTAESAQLSFDKSWWHELAILLGRNMMDASRDKVMLGATLGQALFVALFLGCTFLQIANDQTGIQTRVGSLFFITTNLVFSTVQPILLIWPLERLIVQRERASHAYRTSAAFVAKSISVLPLRLLASTIMSSLLYLLLGYQLNFVKYMIFLAIVLAFSFCVLSLGLFLGSAAPSVKLAQIVAPMLLITFLLYGGNIGPSTSIPVALSWIQYISPIKYAYMALFQNEFSGLTFTAASPAEAHFTTGEQVIALYQMDTFPIYLCLILLLLLGVLFQVLGLLALRRTTRPKLNLSI
jgi:hypothetical protein